MFEDQQPDEQNNQDLNESLDSSIPNDNTSDNGNIIDNNDILSNLNLNEIGINIPSSSEQKSESESIPETASTNTQPQFTSTPKDNETNDETPVTVQPVQFASFDEEENVHGKENKNLDLLMNVNLQMSVELGRTELPFKKVLELTRGSIISLDKLAGEPVELFANGKLVAFGEVVVIEDNFGLRITSIAAPEERLKTVHETTSSDKK